MTFVLPTDASNFRRGMPCQAQGKGERVTAVMLVEVYAVSAAHSFVVVGADSMLAINLRHRLTSFLSLMRINTSPRARTSNPLVLVEIFLNKKVLLDWD